MVHQEYLIHSITPSMKAGHVPHSPTVEAGWKEADLELQVRDIAGKLYHMWVLQSGTLS